MDRGREAARGLPPSRWQTERFFFRQRNLNPERREDINPIAVSLLRKDCFR